MHAATPQLFFRQISDKLIQQLEEGQFAGWDPFDALNSRLFDATPLASSPLARLAWTQLFKRSPVNFRKLAGIVPSINPVTIALAAEIYRRDGDNQRGEAMVHQLISMATNPDQSGAAGWGYPFSWQAKAFFVPKGAPNVIATAYAVRELANWKEILSSHILPPIVKAATYVEKHLVRRGKSGRYLAYVESSDAMVHNASLWGAYVLAVGWQFTANREWLNLACEAVEYSLRAQREDGSWLYGEADHHQFIDGFHTGYVLEALHRIAQIGVNANCANAVDRGLSFYSDNLFESDGTARYYFNRRFPIDGNCAAQCVILHDALGILKSRSAWVCRVSEKVVQQLWLPRVGRFAYQRSAHAVNKMHYPRWTQIWLALALRIAASGPRPTFCVSKKGV